MRPGHYLRVENPVTPTTARPIPAGGALTLQGSHYQGKFAADEVGTVDVDYGRTDPIGGYREVCSVVVKVLADDTSVLCNGSAYLKNPLGGTQRNCVLSAKVGNLTETDPLLGRTFLVARPDFGATASVGHGAILDEGWHRFEFAVTGDWGWDCKLHGQAYGPSNAVEVVPSPVLSIASYSSREYYLPDTPWLLPDAGETEYFSGTVVRTYRLFMNWSYSSAPSGGKFARLGLDDWNAALGIYGPHVYDYGTNESSKGFDPPPYDTSQWTVQSVSGSQNPYAPNHSFYYLDPGSAGFEGFMHGYLRLIAQIDGGPSSVEVSHDNENWTTIGSGTLDPLQSTTSSGTPYAVPGHLRFLRQTSNYESHVAVGEPGMDVIAAKMVIGGQTMFDLGDWD